MGRLFGTDGVRGVANTDLTPELAFKLGRSAAMNLDSQKGISFLIGKDTRVSGDMLESALIAGITSAGCNALKAGVIPTPAVAYLVKSYRADAGVVISASHNPIEDNGIKFFNSSGFKLSDEVEDEIERNLEEEGYRPVGGAIGKVKTLDDAEERYISHAIESVPLNLTGMRIALDCANGAASRTTSLALKRLGAEVTSICVEPDGVNINDGCGSTKIENLKKLVEQGNFDLGLSHDGDADRVIAVDENGSVVDGDFIMAICAKNMLNKGELKRRSVVGTVMSNLGFHIAMKSLGIEVYTASVGDRYVIQEMINNRLNLGGEQSGHIIFLDYNTTGDGLITALMLLRVMRETGEKLSTLCGIMKKMPQRLINVQVKTKNFEKSRAIMDMIVKKEKELGDAGRVLVRASGTEPLIRVMVEAETDEMCRKYAESIASVIEKELG